MKLKKEEYLKGGGRARLAIIGSVVVGWMASFLPSNVNV